VTRNPILNAIAASLYIILIVFVMNTGMRYAPKNQSFLAPVAMVSLFTLSAAVMGYLFCYQPMQLYFSENKKQGIELFLQTVVVFGVLTAIVLGLLFSGILI